MSTEKNVKKLMHAPVTSCNMSQSNQDWKFSISQIILSITIQLCNAKTLDRYFSNGSKIYCAACNLKVCLLEIVLYLFFILKYFDFLCFKLFMLVVLLDQSSVATLNKIANYTWSIGQAWGGKIVNLDFEGFFKGKNMRPIVALF